MSSMRRSSNSKEREQTFTISFRSSFFTVNCQCNDEAPTVSIVFFSGLSLEVIRVLRSEERFLFSMPYAENLTLNQIFCPEWRILIHRVGHIQSFDQERLRSLLLHAVFQIERRYLTTFVDWQRPSMRNRLKITCALGAGASRGSNC